jgi:type IV secretion system protein VirD4
LASHECVKILQILFAPREQRDAEEYSAMLGYFTEQAISRGRSHSLAPQGHTTTSLNESSQRRALLMPQEFKEIGSERQVLILENCKPILATKIRYYKDAAFKERLLAAPAIRPLRIDIHLARVQGRVRLLDGDLLAEEGLDMEALAYDLDTLPQNLDGSAEAVAAMLFDFLAEWSASALDSQANAGGAIEPLPDAYGVLIDADECRTASAPAHAGEPSPEKESPCLLERS